MEQIEDHMHGVWTEWAALKDKWFHGEKMDPVFEGVVRDFCIFDETMHNIYQKVGCFMKGVDQLGAGMTQLSEGVSKGLSHTNDSQISSDSCKLKEATNQIARVDAPHSAIAKLRRDMHFNILNPVQNHIANNRNLKVSLDIRRRRLIELNGAKKAYEDCVKRNLSHQDKRFLTAQAALESAKMTFNDVDRHVFEWLYILEEYRGDILDSTLQTLKYLQYEFFAASAHAISTSLPSRMEFRPMVEMTPEHLEAQVEMELQESEEQPAMSEDVYDFSTRLIEKKARDDPGDEVAQMPVDPLSLSSLLSQGFEEGPARRALRLHQNNTQAALDWLINGQNEVAEKQKMMTEGVRMPTTVKRVQKLKAMRKAQQERQRSGRGDREGASNGSPSKKEAASSSTPSRSSTSAPSDDRKKKERSPSPPQRTPKDMLSGDDVEESDARRRKAASAAKPPAAAADLLSLEEEPPPPTDFTRELEFTALPTQLAFEDIRCEKQPLPAAVAAGIAKERSQEQGVAPDLMAQVRTLAAESQVSPQQLLLAAQQLQAQQNGAAAGPGAVSMAQGMSPTPAAAFNGTMHGPMQGSPAAASGWGAMGSLQAPMSMNRSSGPVSPGSSAPGGFASLDPLASSTSAAPAGYAPAAPGAPLSVAAGYPVAASSPATTSESEKDKFGDLLQELK